MFNNFLQKFKSSNKVKLQTFGVLLIIIGVVLAIVGFQQLDKQNKENNENKKVNNTSIAGFVLLLVGIVLFVFAHKLVKE
jgi:uncharacterized membrane protein YidH (DUF202 family)